MLTFCAGRGGGEFGQCPKEKVFFRGLPLILMKRQSTSSLLSPSRWMTFSSVETKFSLKAGTTRSRLAFVTSLQCFLYYFVFFSFSIFIYFFSLQGRSRLALVISLQSGRHGSCVGQNAMIGICARLASAQCAVQCTVHSAESRCTIALHCRDPDSNLNSSAIFNAPPPLLKEEIATFLYCFILNRHNILWVSISTILCKNSSKCKNQTNVEKIISRSYWTPSVISTSCIWSIVQMIN